MYVSRFLSSSYSGQLMLSGHLWKLEGVAYDACRNFVTFIYIELDAYVPFCYPFDFKINHAKMYI